MSKKNNGATEKLFARLQNKPEYEFVEVAENKPVVLTKKVQRSANGRYGSLMSLEPFCELLSEENSAINILKILDLPLTKFVKATQEQIDSNPHDKENGVTDVYITGGLHVFGIFDFCVHKIYRDGMKQYFFHTTTHDPATVISVSRILYQSLGVGLYDNYVRHSFRETQHIHDLAQGFFSSVRDECQTMWFLKNNLTLHLNYHVDPPAQLALSIDEKKPAKRTNISRNDSLLNYINFDLNGLLVNATECGRHIEEDGTVRFIDYIMPLGRPFLEIFTKVRVRIFGNKKEFSESVYTHLYFYTKNNIINVNDIRIATNALLSIYGTDNNDSGELRDYEVNNIEERGTWSGRMYDFNTDHRLSDSENNSTLYHIWLSFKDITDEGLVLSVLGFDKMVEYMKGRLL